MRFQRARKKEQIVSRRQEILCAAEQLFNEGGLDNVTFSHIAKQVSFTRQTIYTYYQTREEVLLDLLGQRLEHFYQSLEAMFPGATTSAAPTVKRYSALSFSRLKFFVNRGSTPTPPAYSPPPKRV